MQFTEDRGDYYVLWNFDEDTGNLTRTVNQYCSLIMDDCALARDTTNNGYSESREMQLVGRIPIAMANEMHATGQIFDDDYMAKHFWNNSEFKNFRIGGGTI